MESNAEAAFFFVKPVLISCILCKQNRHTQERMFMFGGRRPFMARFEEKVVKMVGRERFLNLKKKKETDLGRSYICKHCHSLIDKTYENIQKIQEGIARSVQMASTHHCESGTTHHKQDIKIPAKETKVLGKKKLPPASERLAEKIASITIVKINNKTPLVVLYKLKTDNVQGEIQTSDVQMKVLQEKGPFLTCSKGEMNLTSNTILKTSLAGSNLLPKEINSDAAFGGTTIFDSRHLDTRPDRDNKSSKNSEIMSSQSSERGIKVQGNSLWKVKSSKVVKLAEIKNSSVYICGRDNCDWIFASKFLLENHIRHYHFCGKPYKCPFHGCNQYFPSKSKCQQHSLRHTNERPYMCERCGKAFRVLQDLQHHKLTHSAVKSYQCPKSGCYKSFKYASSLKRHVQFHDGDLPFPCAFDNCTKKFKNAYELKCHRRLHTGEKPYRCPHLGCGATFRLSAEYTKHRRSHTGERPFRCIDRNCSATFSTGCSLANHVASQHSYIQPFCCDVCGKTFKHKSSYKAHARRHANQNPHSDPMGDSRKTFQDPPILRNNQKSTALPGETLMAHSLKCASTAALESGGVSGSNQAKHTESSQDEKLHLDAINSTDPYISFSNTRLKEGCVTTSGDLDNSNVSMLKTPIILPIPFTVLSAETSALLGSNNEVVVSETLAPAHYSQTYSMPHQGFEVAQNVGLMQTVQNKISQFNGDICNDTDAIIATEAHVYLTSTARRLTPLSVESTNAFTSHSLPVDSNHDHFK